MSMKSKGTNAERELLHKFWESGFVAMRAPGSGSMRYPCPDLLVGNAVRKLAIECKATSKESQYISSDQINDLKKFAAIFGAEPWVAVRFNMTRMEKRDWFFINLEDLKETKGNNYVITFDYARVRGLFFNEVIK